MQHRGHRRGHRRRALDRRRASTQPAANPNCLLKAIREATAHGQKVRAAYVSGRGTGHPLVRRPRRVGPGRPELPRCPFGTPVGAQRYQRHIPGPSWSTISKRWRVRCDRPGSGTLTRWHCGFTDAAAILGERGVRRGPGRFELFRLRRRRTLAGVDRQRHPVLLRFDNLPTVSRSSRRSRTSSAPSSTGWTSGSRW